MLRAMRRWLRFLLICALAATVSACVRQRGKPASLRPLPWLRWSVATAPSALDAPCRNRSCWREAALVGEGLVRLDAAGGSLQVAGLLADRWEWRSATELVFHLSDRARWSDGSRLTAVQVIRTWQTLLHDCALEPTAQLLFPVVNAAAFCEGKLPFSQVGFQATDASTVRIELMQASFSFPRVFAHPALWPWQPALTIGPFLPPPRAAERLAKTDGTAGSFPFARNPFYHGPLAPIAGVEMQVEPSAEIRVARFRDHTTDIVDDLDSSLAARLQADPGIRTAHTGRRVSLVFNPTRRPFTETAVRQAFAAAIAREEPIHLLKWPFTAAVGFSLALREGAPTHGIGFSLAQAAQWLRSVRWDAAQLHFTEEGQVRPFPRPTLAWTDFRGAPELAENLQAQWMKAFHIRVELSGAIVPAQWNTSAPALVLVEYTEDPLVPWASLTRFTKGRALGGWDNADFDERIERAAHAATADELESAIDQAEALLVDHEAVVAPLLSEGRIVLQSDRLRQLTEDPTGHWNFSNVVLE
jgi:oligopeptide transport system substrate-binding protein